MSSRKEDLKLLAELLNTPHVTDDDVYDRPPPGRLSVLERERFDDMQRKLLFSPALGERGRRQEELTERQRSWVKGIYERVFDVPQYENLMSSGKAPVGEYGKSAVPAVLCGTLPKKPPDKR